MYKDHEDKHGCVVQSQQCTQFTIKPTFYPANPEGSGLSVRW